MSHPRSTMWRMGTVIELASWKRSRGPAPEAVVDAGSVVGRDVARLDTAVQHLGPMVSSFLDRGRLDPRVETELLAIIGEVSVGLVTEAATRAERLVGKLQARAAGQERRG
jgi:hypothetical protein